MVTTDMLRTNKGKCFFFGEKIQFVIVLDLIKCLDRSINKKLPLTCAPFSGLPFDIGTMFR